MIKKIYLILLTLLLSNCSDDDCDGKVTEINNRYDLLISEEINNSSVPDLDYIQSLEEDRENELGRACDQSDIMPFPEIPQP